MCVCVQTPEIMWKAGAFPRHRPFSEVAADHFSLCFVVKLSGFHNQVSQSRMQRPYDARAPLFAAFRPHHTDTVRTGCTLWKRLCFIEIQQTSTGCFAGLGDRNRARMLFKQRKKKKNSWLLFSFNPTDPRDAASPRTQLSQDEFAFGPGREASLWRRGRNKNKLVLQISLGSKMLVCEVKNRTRLECWRIWKCSGLFLCPGLLLDSSSSRRSRTSVMKQGWPQLPLKTQSEHLVFPKVMLGFVKSFFLGWLQFFCAFFCRSVGALIPSFDFFSHVNQDLKTQLERMQWVWWFAYAKLPETGSDSTCRTAEGFSETKVLLQKSRLDCLTS